MAKKPPLGRRIDSLIAESGRRIGRRPIGCFSSAGFARGVPMSAGANVQNSDVAVTSMPVKRDASQLRMWFPLALIAAYWAFIYVNQNYEFSAAGRFISRMIALLLFFVVFAVWWLTRSIISWRDRFLAIVIVVAISTVAVLLAHKSMSAFGFFL